MNAPRAEARRWFQQAQADMAVVRTLRSAGHHAAACFHSQQAAEKALKAVLFAHGARIVLGHSVQELIRQCETHDEAFTSRTEEAPDSTNFISRHGTPMDYQLQPYPARRSPMRKVKPLRMQPSTLYS
jgi:HEPN domain-containing protein